MIDYLVTDLVESSRRRIVDAGVTSVEEVRARREWLIALSERAAERNGDLKRYLKEKLYRHHRIERVKEKFSRILIALFERYTENPLLLPESFRARFETDGRERVICDYVAGMTDRYAMNEYRRLFDVEILP
jgi:dGTPase